MMQITMANLQNILLLFLMETLTFHGISSELVISSRLAPSVNAPTSLKPLTPIAGTNLFLNLPYKWHDHTKPGCYVTWLKEMYPENQLLECVTMVCNKDDQQWYNTPHASWIFERTQGAESTDEYNGKLRIKNVGSKHYLVTSSHYCGSVLKERPNASPVILLLLGIESLKSFAKITAKAGIPLIGEVETELGLETNYEAKQEWKNSVEKSFELSYEVNIPPQTNVKISAWYDLIKGISMDYTARTEISGKTSRISIFDDVVDDSPATGEMIRRQLDYLKFDGEIVEIKEFSVIARIKGTMVASLGVRGQLNVNGDTVSTTD